MTDHNYGTDTGIPPGYRRARCDEVYTNDERVVVLGTPDDLADDDPKAHNCDDMGCGSFGPHVLFNLSLNSDARDRALAEAAGLKQHAIRVIERDAEHLQLPDAHGGAFAKKYAHNALLACAGTLRSELAPSPLATLAADVLERAGRVAQLWTMRCKDIFSYTESFTEDEAAAFNSFRDAVDALRRAEEGKTIP